MATERKTEGKMDMQEMMELYRRLGTPGAPHKLLASMAGSWNARVKSWMEPGSPPSESTGTSEARMILGGRFLHEEFSGDMMGTPFQGMGITGYDNHARKYVSAWIDSMGTALLYCEGTAGTESNTITTECRHEDPVKGPMNWRTFTRILDNDNHVFEMYAAERGGKEEKVLEITYSRKR